MRRHAEPSPGSPANSTAHFRFEIHLLPSLNAHLPQIAAASGRVGMPRNQILANNKLYAAAAQRALVML
jgi:hypothetical protein